MLAVIGSTINQSLAISVVAFIFLFFLFIHLFFSQQGYMTDKTKKRLSETKIIDVKQWHREHNRPYRTKEENDELEKEGFEGPITSPHIKQPSRKRLEDDDRKKLEGDEKETVIFDSMYDYLRSRETENIK